MTSNNKRGSVRSAETLFEIVEYIKSRNGSTITEVADELGYAKSTVYRHLSTLTDLGYLIKEDDGFHVSLQFLDIGQQARKRQPGYEMAKEKIEEIAEETGERAQFLVEEHGKAVYIHRAFGDRAVHTDPGIGSHIPLHATAAGKAILANMDDDERAEVIEELDFQPITESTITNQEQLQDELEEIRERGYSYNHQENLTGLHSVGVAVRGRNSNVIGAFSVSGPSHRLKGDLFEREIPSLLLGTVNEFELNIVHS